MKSNFSLSGKGWFAVILVVSLLTAFTILTGQILVAMVAFCTAGTAAFDSTHIHLRRYKTWLSYGPIGLFVVGALFWPLAVVWYFIVRVRIARGTMPLKNEFASRLVKLG